MGYFKIHIEIFAISGGMRLPAPPLDNKRLVEARYQRQKEIMMKSALKNVVVNLFICWILFSISYSNRDNRSYFLHMDVHKQILAPEGSPQFMDVRQPLYINIFVKLCDSYFYLHRFFMHSVSFLYPATKK